MHKFTCIFLAFFLACGATAQAKYADLYQALAMLKQAQAMGAHDDPKAYLWLLSGALGHLEEEIQNDAFLDHRAAAIHRLQYIFGILKTDPRAHISNDLNQVSIEIRAAISSADHHDSSIAIADPETNEPSPANRERLSYALALLNQITPETAAAEHAQIAIVLELLLLEPEAVHCSPDFGFAALKTNDLLKGVDEHDARKVAFNLTAATLHLKKALGQHSGEASSGAQQPQDQDFGSSTPDLLPTNSETQPTPTGP